MDTPFYSIHNTLKVLQIQRTLAKTWEITVNNADVSKIEEWLKSLNSEYEIMSGNNMKIDAVGFLIATDGSYEHKEELKQNGFYWNADKKRWQKKISMQDYEKEIYTLRTLQKKVKIQLEKPKKKR